MPRALALLLCLCLPAAAQTPGDQVRALLDEDLEAFARRYPYWAESMGRLADPDTLPDGSLDAWDAWAADTAQRLERLEAIPADDLDAETALDRDLLALELRDRIEAHRFGEHLLAITHLTWPRVLWPPLGQGRRAKTQEERERYVRRLEHVQVVVRQVRARLDEGRSRGVTPPAVTMVDVPAQLQDKGYRRYRRHPEEHAYYAPLAKRPRRDPLAKRARAAIKAAVKEIGDLRTYLREEYVPTCRKEIGAPALPQGEEWYAWRLRRFGAGDLTPEQVHDLGWKLVRELEADLLVAVARCGVKARAGEEPQQTLRRAFAKLRRDKTRLPREAKDLTQAYQRAARRLEAALGPAFGELELAAWEVRPLPRDAAYAVSYFPGGESYENKGFLVVNTSHLDQRPLYEVLALTAHELVPGHHLQRCVSQALPLHPWRLAAMQGYREVFVEGWGLYAERLALELGDGERGLYADPYDETGRLSTLMWRTLRLVVDTGLHAKGWTRERAVQTLLDHCAISEINAQREVDRYLTNPGQALAYRLGELAIRELREQAEAALEDRFDLPAFHRMILGGGELPLPQLKARVEAWLSEQAQAPAGQPR